MDPPRPVWVLGEQIKQVNRGDEKCSEGHPEPGVVFGCRPVLLRLCLHGRKLNFCMLMLEKNLKSVKGTLTMLVQREIQVFMPSWFKLWFTSVDCHLLWRVSGIQEVSLQSFWFYHKETPDLLLTGLPSCVSPAHSVTPLLLHWLFQYASSVYKIFLLFPAVVMLAGFEIGCGFDKGRSLLNFNVCWT